mmetsp:Transcript_48447/g.90805  ORF Transcript_48447/g.90805 Transcript_48447/m.90805 type:complete len:289 (-) Transcript_48447:5-871(-)
MWLVTTTTRPCSEPQRRSVWAMSAKTLARWAVLSMSSWRKLNATESTTRARTRGRPLMKLLSCLTVEYSSVASYARHTWSPRITASSCRAADAASSVGLVSDSKASQTCMYLRGTKDPSVSTKTASAKESSVSDEIWAAAQSCKQNCVLPLPGKPHTSNNAPPPVKTLPRRALRPSHGRRSPGAPWACRSKDSAESADVQASLAAASSAQPLTMAPALATAPATWCCTSTSLTASGRLRTSAAVLQPRAINESVTGVGKDCKIRRSSASAPTGMAAAMASSKEVTPAL